MSIAPEILKQANDALDIAKLQLMAIKKSVFTTTILFSLKTNWDEKIPTLNVDGVTLKINPTFFIGLDKQTRVFALAHEAWHIAFEHISRWVELIPTLPKDKTPEQLFPIYNQAADHVINNMLMAKGYKVPDWACCNSQYGNMTTEQVFYDLLKKNQSNPDFIPDFTPAGSGNDGKDDPKNGLSAEDIKNKIDDMLVKANVANNMADKDFSESVPNAVLDRIEELVNPVVPWHMLLRNYMFSTSKEDYSYKRPSRRYLPDIVVPTLYSPSMGKIGIGIDISGSISQEEFSAFLSETNEIKQSLNPDTTEVIQWHHQIADVTEVSRYEDMSGISFKETGGTNIHPLLDKWAASPPEIAVIFTDGYFRPYDKPEEINFPVIWVIYNNDSFKPAFGDVIYYDPNH